MYYAARNRSRMLRIRPSYFRSFLKTVTRQTGRIAGFAIIALLLSCSISDGTHKTRALRRHRALRYHLNIEANRATEKAVRSGFQIWENSTDFRFIFAGRSRAGLHRDGKNTVSFLRKWPKNIPHDKVAWCQNWFDAGGYIIESDIIFNMQLARFTTMDTRSADSYTIEILLAHEIGHMLGLNHIESRDSIMNARVPLFSAEFENSLDPLSVNAYRELYPAE